MNLDLIFYWVGKIEFYTVTVSISIILVWLAIVVISRLKIRAMKICHYEARIVYRVAIQGTFLKNKDHLFKKFKDNDGKWYRIIEVEK